MTRSTPSATAADAPRLPVRLAAEAVGTFWLVLAGCGTAVLAGDEVGYVGIALAFGLAVLTMAYAVGHVSGGHFNPAVTLGLAVGRRFAWRDVPAYVAVQVAGASLAGAVVLLVAFGADGFTTADGLASNGFGERSPGGYDLVAAAVAEVLLTAIFVWIVMGSTDRRAPVGFAPISIGLGLTLIHLVSIPVTNTSVNPARSLGVAWFATDGALGQVWLFLLAPLLGAVIAGASYAVLTGADRAGAPVDGTADPETLPETVPA